MPRFLISALLLACGLVSGLACDQDDERDAYVDMQICEDKCEDVYDACVCGDPPAQGCDPEDDYYARPAAATCMPKRDECLAKC